MMNRSHCYCFYGIITILFSFLFHTFASPPQHFCRHDQRDALLEFKDEFTTEQFFIFISSWNKSTDCCFWYGVRCDHRSGQVISLDLSLVIFLNSSLKTTSSLFKLQYLRHLNLRNCNLQGGISSSLGNLSRLTFLDLSWNQFVGEIPASIGNLNQLRNLSLWHNHLTGEIPSSLGNLSRLLDLQLWDNDLVGEVPASIGNLKELRVMWLNQNSLSGNIPTSFANLTKVFDFSISSNNFTSSSTLTTDMSGFHSLEGLDVSDNSFLGPFPKSLFSNHSLLWVDVGGNQFTGPIEFGNTSSSSSSKLRDLFLWNNRFDNGPIPESIFELLNLRSLSLSQNKFTGPIPSSFGKSSQETVMEQLDLNWNSFRGPFPHWICMLKELHILDLSNNLFNDSIPPCLRNLTFSLRQLILRNNSFSGTLPDIFDNASLLRSFDVSRNQLEGKFPMSLINCGYLELVNVESNKFRDEFPSLHVLSLRSNEFYGPLYQPHVSIGFESLRVIDISLNDFTGTLPSYYFSDWSAMTMTTFIDGIWEYMQDYVNSFVIYRSIEMVNKGVDARFERIRQDFRAIDFSGNGFLKELRLLNLSRNAFTINIPRFLSNLTNLETLDLSRNKLSGQIPQDLDKLSFLSCMNFSHNLLQGPVPRGTQFQRQKCSSFTDNPRLYGLEDICGEAHVPSPTASQQHPEELSEESEEEMFNWVAAAIAYGPGVFCGLVIGYIFTSHNHEWFTEKFGRRKLRVTTRAR
ncbi:unnamed protein product [Arabis nemorensis]|uniref:Uncharacterized protein n=1 Tax=Arabis nemorensis TaxID=586526 RepID=A0A565AZI2_9BRAS|nr:unnamed protein product [Arabis nemorensis]